VSLSEAAASRLGPVGSRDRGRFLVRPVTNTAFDRLRAGRGLAGSVVGDANDLAHATAEARTHGGSSAEHDGFRPCTASLTQDFGYRWHRCPAAEVLPTASTVADTCQRYKGGEEPRRFRKNYCPLTAGAGCRAPEMKRPRRRPRPLPIPGLCPFARSSVPLPTLAGGAATGRDMASRRPRSLRRTATYLRGARTRRAAVPVTGYPRPTVVDWGNYTSRIAVSTPNWQSVPRTPGGGDHRNPALCGQMCQPAALRPDVRRPLGLGSRLSRRALREEEGPARRAGDRRAAGGLGGRRPAPGHPPRRR
jgi:hypothetical protein